MYSPVSGTVLEINPQLGDQPALVNTSPFGDAWMMKVKLSKPAGALTYTCTRMRAVRVLTRDVRDRGCFFAGCQGVRSALRERRALKATSKCSRSANEMTESAFADSAYTGTSAAVFCEVTGQSQRAPAAANLPGAAPH